MQVFVLPVNSVAICSIHICSLPKTRVPQAKRAEEKPVIDWLGEMILMELTAVGMEVIV